MRQRVMIASDAATRDTAVPATTRGAATRDADADADRAFSTADFTASGTVITFRGFLTEYHCNLNRLQGPDIPMFQCNIL